MKILGNDKPIYCITSNFKTGKTKKLNSVFSLSTGINNTIICPTNKSSMKQKIHNRFISVVDKSKKYFVLNIDKTSKTFLKEKLELNIVENIDDADIIIVKDIFEDTCLSSSARDYVYIETKDKIYDITNSIVYMGVNSKTAFNLFKRNGFFEDNDYHRLDLRNFCTASSYGNELFNETLYGSNKPLIVLEDVFKSYVKNNSILSEEELKSIEELLESPSKDNIKLGILLVGTSNFMELFYTIRAIFLKHSRNILSKMYVSEIHSLSPALKELAIDDLFSEYHQEFKITDLSVLFNRKEDMSEMDNKLLKSFLKKDLDNCINKLISNKSKKNLEKLGYNFEAKLIEI